jgi:predicted ABC-type ATPase
MVSPSLLVIAGPNGSGKSSLIARLRARGIDLGAYINADDIELGLKDMPDPQLRSREAQKLADAQRAECLEGKQSFSFETVMSHPSKIDLMQEAREQGYHVSLAFVAVDNPGVNVRRVALRVSQGGHPVPEDRIVARYSRTLALLPRAILVTHEAVLFDNSEAGSGPRPIAEFRRSETGFFIRVLDQRCAWLRRELLEFLPFSALLSGITGDVHAPFATIMDADQRRTADLTFP